jgi:iron complex outermembrane receptor protein
VNAAQQTVSGIDVEASYRMPIGPGEAAFRVIGNYMLEQSRLLDGIFSDNVGSLTANTPGGQAGLPRLKLTANARYNFEPFTIGLEMQMTGKAKLNTYWTDADIRSEDNQVPAVFFFNLQASYDFEVMGGNLNAYINVQNVLDRGPPQLPTLYNGAGGNPIWDPYGRVFRGGIRAKF